MYPKVSATVLDGTSVSLGDSLTLSPNPVPVITLTSTLVTDPFYGFTILVVLNR